MRVLIVGAGAIGGYFGGRMLQAGRDITFLVRPRRALELAAAGLVIKSPNGDVTLKNPPVVQADTIKDKFDVVLLSCKAYDLDDAIKSFAPAIGEGTSIIPLLNGMRHLDVLDKCRAVATAEGYPPRAPALERATAMFTTEGSPLTASMFRDIKAGQPVEADHVIGDLIARADTAKIPVPRLRTAYAHLKAYEQARG